MGDFFEGSIDEYNRMKAKWAAEQEYQASWSPEVRLVYTYDDAPFWRVSDLRRHQLTPTQFNTYGHSRIVSESHGVWDELRLLCHDQLPEKRTFWRGFRWSLIQGGQFCFSTKAEAMQIKLVFGA